MPLLLRNHLRVIQEEDFMRLVLLFSVLFPGVAVAATITSFDYPRAKTTCATAIASNGAIAGLASGGTLGSAIPFVFLNGHFSQPKPKVPAGVVLFSGINAGLDVVGTDLEIGQVASVPFLLAQGKTSSPLIGGAQPSLLSGITDGGTLLGTIAVQNTSNPILTTYVAATQTSTGHTQVLNDGSLLMNPTGIDSTGKRVTGTSDTASGIHAWSYYNGVFTTLQVPEATLGTWPHAVDSKGKVRGFYITGAQSASVAHGFLYENGAYQTYEVPGASSTQIQAANESGQFAGCYTDQSGTHGFYVTP
jgi:hypothetical protein